MNKILLIIVLASVLTAVWFSLTQNIKKDGTKSVDRKTSVSLKDTVAGALEGTKGTYAVVIKNLTTGESYLQNQDRVFEPGSLYKLWVMGTVFEKMNTGELKEDEILSQDVAVLNREFQIDEDQAEMRDGTITMSVGEALNQMIAISHNYAALLLLQRVKNSQVELFIKENGLNDSDLGIPPKTTASDMAIFWEKLYKGELVNKESSQRAIELLKKQELNEGLPKYLPQGVEIAHKTGDIGWFKHDAGIVFTNKGDYIIVVLSESDSPVGAQERIAQLSQAVYNYFML